METVRIRTPQSLLRLLPRLVGEPGAPSLVALPFASGRSGMPMLLDLPQPETVAGIAHAIRAGSLGADAVVLVACFATPLGAGPLPLRDELVRVAAHLERSGIRILELLAIAADSWGDYSHPGAARGPLAELDLLDDPAPGVPALPQLPAVPQAADPDAERAVGHWLDSLTAGDLAAARDDPVAALELAVAQASKLRGQSSPLGINPAKTAALAVALVESPAQRDLAIELALDGVDAARRTLAGATGGRLVVSDAAAERFLGRGPAPDAARLHERLRCWSAIAEATPLEARAPLLVIVGFLHFFLGRGRTAGRCAELATALDPGLTMAPLLRDIIDAQGAPQWVLADRRP